MYSLRYEDVAMVSPSATAVGLKNYDAFYRTIQGDGTAAAAIVKIVKFLGFPYVQVIDSKLQIMKKCLWKFVDHSVKISWSS